MDNNSAHEWKINAYSREINEILSWIFRGCIVCLCVCVQRVSSDLNFKLGNVRVLAPKTRSFALPFDIRNNNALQHLACAASNRCLLHSYVWQT